VRSFLGGSPHFGLLQLGHFFGAPVRGIHCHEHRRHFSTGILSVAMQGGYFLMMGKVKREG